MLRPILQALRADPYHDIGQVNTGARLRKLASPRYVLRKLAVTLYEMRHPDHPWITREAIERLDGALRREHRVFEWGSGGSTIWLASRVKLLVSVEHNAQWAARVRGRLQATGITNVDYRAVGEHEYLAQIDAFPLEHFDVVMVDALFRGDALLRSIPRLRRGGLIVFDNVNWYFPSASRTPHSRAEAEGPSAEAAAAWEIVRNWPVIWTSNGVNDTALFTKPE